MGGSPAGIPGLLLRSERGGFARAGRAAVCVGVARDGALRRVDYSAPLGRAVVRETGTALLDERRRISTRSGHGTGAPAPGRAVGHSVPGLLLVDLARRIQLPYRMVGNPDSRQ